MMKKMIKLPVHKLCVVYHTLEYLIFKDGEARTIQ